LLLDYKNKFDGQCTQAGFIKKTYIFIPFYFQKQCCYWTKKIDSCFVVLSTRIQSESYPITAK